MKIDNLLLSKGYKSISMMLRSSGPYSARDSEWNYSDVPHLNYIHSRVDSCTLLVNKSDIVNIFLQKVGPFLLPAAVHINHIEAARHNYVMTILNIVITVTTDHKDTAEGCNTDTKYTFFYRGILGLVVALLARHATKANYKTLMSEDMPMRLQRAKLRREGFSFKLDREKIIGFSDTLNISSNNLNANQPFQEPKSIIIDLSDPLICVNLYEFKMNAIWDDNTVWILPMICPHEGAELCFPKINNTKTTHCLITHCPWHGRQLKPLISLVRTDQLKRSFSYLYVDFTAQIIGSDNSSSLKAEKKFAAQKLLLSNANWKIEQ